MAFFGNKNEAVMEAAGPAGVPGSGGMDDHPEAGEAAEAPKRKPFALWEVGGETYRLKLRTPAIVELEGRYKTNLMNIMGSGQGGMPALSVMLDVAHAAMKEWHHGITKGRVADMFSQYVEEGGSQLSFYMTVYMEVFTVSGFFSVGLSDQMHGALEEAWKEGL